MPSATLNGVVPVAGARCRTSRVTAPTTASEPSAAAGWASMVSGWKALTPTGIRQIVRHEQDATRRQPRVVPPLRKLVVGTAADNAAAQARDGRVVQYCA